MGAPGDPLLALVVPGTICGEAAALAVVIAGSDFRPSEYPSAKNVAQTPTSPKNRNSSLPVPSVISVSCEAAIAQLLWQSSAREPPLFLRSLRWRRRLPASQQLLQP